MEEIATQFRSIVAKVQKKIAGEKGFALLLCPLGVPEKDQHHGQIYHIPLLLVMQLGNLFLLGLGTESKQLSCCGLFHATRVDPGITRLARVGRSRVFRIFPLTSKHPA